MSWPDRLLGIALGLLIGIALVIIFVFAGPSESIDAPSLDPPPIEREAEAGR